MNEHGSLHQKFETGPLLKSILAVLDSLAGTALLLIAHGAILRAMDRHGEENSAGHQHEMVNA